MDIPEVNPDLLKERRTATFSVEAMTYVIDGGEDMTNRRREIQGKALKDPTFTGGPPSCFLSRDEQYSRAVKKAVRLNEFMEEMQILPTELPWLLNVAFPLEISPDNGHRGMFLPTIMNQANEDQKLRWLPRIRCRQYLGTYSQTELGHGTHLRNLETTATYDSDTEEFVLHSPSTTSMKWWPGGQGKTSNCAVVVAQLHIKGISHGTFPFFVVFRDLDTHQPLPGVTVGDIGPKMGFNTMDNGFLKFDHFRIPRENMLMKHVEVTKDGQFIRKTKQKKPTYLTMTLVRMNIIRVSVIHALAAGMTISIRYSAVRRQSELEPGAPEPQVLDYQTQQHKLFPYLAMTYAFKFAADRFFLLFMEGVGKLRDDDDSMMPELHALSSGLKAYCTTWASRGVDQARLACGGHGYSEASGLPRLYALLLPAATAEGEVTVLFLQLARYLLKCVDRAERGDALDKSIEYIKVTNFAMSSIGETCNLVRLQAAFEHRGRRVILEAARAVKEQMAEGAPEYEAKNRCGVYLVRAARAHCETFIVRNFAEAISEQHDSAIAKVMTQLCQLYAIYRIVDQCGDFLEDGYMSSQEMNVMREKEVSLLADIRHNAVALVDAFDVPDEALVSVLGRYDGHVYENLYPWALESPLNKSDVHDSYYKYLQPMMHSKI